MKNVLHFPAVPADALSNNYFAASRYKKKVSTKNKVKNNNWGVAWSMGSMSSAPWLPYSICHRCSILWLFIFMQHGQLMAVIAFICHQTFKGEWKWKWEWLACTNGDKCGINYIQRTGDLWKRKTEIDAKVWQLKAPKKSLNWHI